MSYQIYIYTLELEDGYYYVGKTTNPHRRFNQHFNKKGSEWTKLHSPIQIVEQESFTVSSIKEEERWENHQTIKMMKAKGWQKVRGGDWCSICEFETIRGLNSAGYFLDVDIKTATLQKWVHFVYLLKLENDKYYVGYTRSLQSAFKKHEKGKMSKWTQANKPIELLKFQEVIFENGIPNIELVNEWVLQCGNEYGYENVRGGSFLGVDDKRHIETIHSFLRKRKK